MKKSNLFIGAGLGLLALAGLTGGGHAWSVAHVQRWTGRPDLGFVNCNHCHLNIEKMPWAQPRPHHAAPAGLVVSPDGQKLYIALDDLDEVVEADAVSHQVIRKLKLEGALFGLALDGKGERLYVTCRDRDKVVAVDTKDWQAVESVEVGEAPVAVAFCTTKAGDRLVVANSISDNISVLTVAPFKEIARPFAGREPYSVAVAQDGSVAFVASRLAVPETHLKVPDSELTLLDPAVGRILLRKPFESAHLAEGTATVPGRPWSLTPLVKVRNLLPITQVANGWVMSSGLAVADQEGNIVQLPLDEAQDFFADPSGIAVDAAGKRAYVASGGADVVSVVDLGRLAGWLAEQTMTPNARPSRT